MDALEFLIERKRMCKSFNRCSDGCPAWGGLCKLEIGTVRECEADKQVEIVKDWAAAHPLKTRQSVFLEQYPEARIIEDGVLGICPANVSAEYRDQSKCLIRPCSVCRRKFWMQEVE